MSRKTYSPTIQQIGATVRAERKARGWKLKDLAERSGLTMAHLSDFETGVCSVSLTSLEAIATAFDRRLSVAFLERPDAAYEGGCVG